MVKDNSFVCIQSFMVNDLHLKGNELIIYAVIYGYTQDGQHWYYGTRAHLAEWCGATKGTVTNCLKSLMRKGYIVRREIERPGYTEIQYQAVAENCNTLSKIDSTPNKNCSDPLSKIDSIDNKDIDNKEIVGKPTLEEVEKFMVGRGASKDYAHTFFDLYESQGWKKANGVKITDWKAAARNWLRKDGVKEKRKYPDSMKCRCGGTMKRTATFKAGTNTPYYRCDRCGVQELYHD